MIPSLTLNPALDKTVYVDRLVVGDTNRLRKVETDAGGKGLNVSRILTHLGTPTVCLGFLGGDAGRYINHRLREEGVPTDFVEIGETTRTNINVQNAVGDPPTLLHERGPTLTPDELVAFWKKLRPLLPRSRYMAMGGTLPLGAPEDLYEQIVLEARDHDVRCVVDVDCERIARGFTARPFMLKPNRAEAERMLGRPFTDAELPAAAKELRAKYGVELVVISLGKEGALAVDSTGIARAWTPNVPTVSTVGCGDSMVAGILSVLQRDGPLEEALRYGSAAGAATAMTDGACIGGRENILALLPQVRVERWE